MPPPVRERCSKKGFRAIPHKSARESDERFFVRKRCKTAGILCVFQGFTNAFLAEKSPRGPHQSPTKYPQGVCRIRSAAKLLTAALWGLVGKGGTAKRLNFCPRKGKMKDTKLVPTQSEDAFVRCCLNYNIVMLGNNGKNGAYPTICVVFMKDPNCGFPVDRISFSSYDSHENNP